MSLKSVGKIRSSLGVIIASILMFAQCVKRIPPEEVRVPLPPPQVYDLRVINGDGGATIVWRSEKKQGQPMLGYNIYISEKEGHDLRDTPPFNSAPYPGDTDGDISLETFEATPLENGVEYLVYVRSLALDGTESEPTETLCFIPRRQGRFTLKQSFHSRESGFDFSEGVSVSARSEDNDLYFYSKPGESGFGSPRRLGEKLRRSLLMDLGTEVDFERMDLFDTGKFNGRERQVIHPGHVYIIKTQENRFGKLKVEKIRGKQGQKEVVIRYCFQPKEDCGRF